MPKKKSKKSSNRPLLKLVLWVLLGLVAAFVVLLLLVRGGAFGKLPSKEELAAVRNEEATLVLANDGSIIGKIFAEDRTNIPYSDLPKHLIDALVATEDQRFFDHKGVDGRSYLRVFFRSLLGGDRSGGGGSTISQQIIKNLYGRERHGILTVPVNKMKEAIVATRLEEVYTKEDVLMLYFNSVPFGENVYGVEAAARRFFSKPAKQLRAEEAAVLVGMLKANTTYNPRLNPKNARGRRDQVLELMSTRGYIAKELKDSLRALPLTVRYAGNDALDDFGYFTHRVKEEATKRLEEVSKATGKTYDLEKDGLRIKTTLDPALQRLALLAIEEHLSAMQPKLDRELRGRKARTAWEKRMSKKSNTAWKRDDKKLRDVFAWEDTPADTMSYRDSLWHYERMLNGAVLMMEPGSGSVRAWVGGNDHRYLPYDQVLAKRPIASAIKPVIYAAALEKGLQPCDYFNNEPRVYTEYDDWEPHNFDHDTTGGRVAMWHALARSMNLATVDLYFRTGADTVGNTFESAWPAIARQRQTRDLTRRARHLVAGDRAGVCGVRYARYHGAAAHDRADHRCARRGAVQGPEEQKQQSRAGRYRRDHHCHVAARGGPRHRYRAALALRCFHATGGQDRHFAGLRRCMVHRVHSWTCHGYMGGCARSQDPLQQRPRQRIAIGVAHSRQCVRGDRAHTRSAQALRPILRLDRGVRYRSRLRSHARSRSTGRVDRKCLQEEDRRLHVTSRGLDEAGEEEPLRAVVQEEVSLAMSR
ncbi:MAG: penicillin-binding protein [Flavobacteriales bacterium]|nr:penicillin-binding protein [Flavobacteriales bacterium]